MIDPSHSSAALIWGLQALLGFGLGALFLYYHRIYRRPYQQYWATGFFAMSLFLICSAIAILLIRPGQSPVGLRGLFSLLSQVFAYLHIGALAIGTLALRAGGSAQPFLTRSGFGAAIVLGAAAWVAFAFGPGDGGDRVIYREGLRYVLTAVTYLGVATALLLGQPWRATAAGQRVVAIAFLCFGFGSLINAAFTSVPGLLEALPSGPWLGLIDLAAVCAIGAGLVVWMHDDERARAQGAAVEVERLTFFDPRTGLPNRRLFVDRLVERLIEADVRGERVAVLAMRPDRVRSLRAALGDSAIDSLVARLALRLGEAGGTGAQLGRADDDRLLLVLSPVSGGEETARRAEALLATLGLSMPGPGGSDLLVTCAIGYSVFPEDGEQAEELITAATAAQAGAAAAGGNRAAPFSRNIGQRNRDDLALAGELRRALANGEFEVHYQPIFDHGQRIVAAEALLRWRHPQRGLLLPTQFLPAAETAGLLAQIDRSVLTVACRFAARHCSAPHRQVRIAVNIAAQTFETPDFTELLTETLSATGIAPDLIELEITEATAMRDLQQAARAIDRIRALGVGLGLDDFGVGYSSMSQLRHLAATTLKIDQSFTAGVETDRRDAAIVSALIRLGHSLDLQVIAEGVENTAQLAFFRAHGADLLQGFLLARPMPEHEFIALLGMRAAAMAAPAVPR